MNAIKLCVIALFSLSLIGCGTMNTNFSCNATAHDSCLTIEQVDAMTRFADDVTPHPSRDRIKAENNSDKEGAVAKMANGESLWLAHKARSQSWA